MTTRQLAREVLRRFSELHVDARVFAFKRHAIVAKDRITFYALSIFNERGELVYTVCAKKAVSEWE